MHFLVFVLLLAKQFFWLATASQKPFGNADVYATSLFHRKAANTPITILCLIQLMKRKLTNELLIFPKIKV